MTLRWRLVAGCWLQALTAALVPAEPPDLPARELEFSGRAMGTTYSVKYWRRDVGDSADNVKRDIEALLDRIDRQMSTYRPDSELSRFAQAAPNAWFAVSPETAFVVGHALQV